MGDEELYAKLGTVIGHEISHVFDPKGSQFGKDGKFQKSAKYCGDTPPFDTAALLLCPCRHTYSVRRQIEFPVLKYYLVPGNREHRAKVGIR